MRFAANPSEIRMLRLGPSASVYVVLMLLRLLLDGMTSLCQTLMLEVYKTQGKVADKRDEHAHAFMHALNFAKASEPAHYTELHARLSAVNHADFRGSRTLPQNMVHSSHCTVFGP